MEIQPILSGSTDPTSFKVNRFSELHLWCFAEFIRSLKEGSVTPEKWYAVAAMLSKIIPGLAEGDSPYVEVNSFEKTGDIYLTVDDLQSVYKALFDIWNAKDIKSSKLSEPDELTPLEDVEALKRKIAELESENA